MLPVGVEIDKFSHESHVAVYFKNLKNYALHFFVNSSERESYDRDN